jgi:hypothetical protein
MSRQAIRGRRACFVVRADVYDDNIQRLCTSCKNRQPIEDFHRRGGGTQSWCKSCRKQYDAEYWQRTRVRRMHLRKQHRRRLVDWYRAMKEDAPCTDCGGAFHHAAMQWDHLPGRPKRREVSNMILTGFRRETILEEIAKCELVCANCHAVRTFDRYGA